MFEKNGFEKNGFEKIGFEKNAMTQNVYEKDIIKDFIEYVKIKYAPAAAISLHEPCFSGNEKAYVNETIDSTFVSSVGKYVERLEQKIAAYVGSKYAVATVNGTTALEICLRLVGVASDDEVITQPLTFVATCNAIAHCGAEPVFIDVDTATLGLSPTHLRAWLNENAECVNRVCVNKKTGRTLRACVPMHTFGHPAQIDAIKAICEEYSIALVEDAAEGLGSFYQGQHVGTFGQLAAFSFNGNKIITTGGGGMLVTDNQELARQAKHLTTTAKVPHQWDYYHDQLGFNYRMPNINAALGCAQMEQLNQLLDLQRRLADSYQEYFSNSGNKLAEFIVEPKDSKSNYWLNAILLENRAQRDIFLKATNESGVMTRPLWKLMHTLPMYQHCQRDQLSNAQWLEDRIVNIPSSVRIEKK